jgi:dihydroorotase
VFDEENALGNFEAFASLNGAAFYSLAANEETVTLQRGEADVPEQIDGMVPFHSGERLGWRVTR